MAKRNILLVLLGTSLLCAQLTFASDSFFLSGTNYLYWTQNSRVEKGMILRTTEQEVIFIDRSVLIHSKGNGYDNEKAIREYLNASNKSALLKPSLIPRPVSFPKSQLMTIKLNDTLKKKRFSK